MNDLVIDTIKENYQQMFSAEKKVADFILQHPEQTVSSNVSELAELSGVSDATVIRMCKHLGYQGFYQMKLNLARDLGQHQLVGYCGDQDNPDTAKAILQGIARNLLNTASKLDMNVILVCAKMIRESEMVRLRLEIRVRSLLTWDSGLAVWGFVPAAHWCRNIF
ncbi:MurR/RpiR family transcriptional regulator [Lacrimispora sp. NSJ-141]|uniref:MurR/RpiR family transcriptional regulator n=1 Tax=Lientehia hominis TaxID=2897778 RepID=A0AAP2RHZ5_9FIRM|nr:MurR/RpiR family transcriptional regulator [Lientehia hominis]MCD2492111.1 MurR/RpiR family transcriptional regulator [Lientehia hominis]